MNIKEIRSNPDCYWIDIESNEKTDENLGIDIAEDFIRIHDIYGDNIIIDDVDIPTLIGKLKELYGIK